MTWGGARVGAGKKPKGEHAIRIRRAPLAVVNQAPDVDGADEPVSVMAPDDLPANQRVFWQENAPKAIAQGTLTWRTVSGFRLLCEQDADRLKIKKTVDKDGWTFIKVTVDGAGQEHQELKAHPLIRDYRALCKSVETLMARFKLAPFGKAEIQVKPKRDVNPWGSFGAR